MPRRFLRVGDAADVEVDVGVEAVDLGGDERGDRQDRLDRRPRVGVRDRKVFLRQLLERLRGLRARLPLGDFVLGARDVAVHALREVADHQPILVDGISRNDREPLQGDVDFVDLDAVVHALLVLDLGRRQLGQGADD